MRQRRADTPGVPAGFTLLETLVAVVLLGMLMTGLSQAMRTSLGASRSQLLQLSRQGDVEAAERTLRSLIERMEPGGVSGRPALFVGESTAMAFTTTLPFGDGSTAGVSADVRLEVDGAHRLVLSWLPHLEVRLQPAPPPTRTVLLEDIERLDLRYWVAPSWTGRWHGPTLPGLIRMRLGATAASGRRLPDIVVAPMRTRWRG